MYNQLLSVFFIWTCLLTCCIASCPLGCSCKWKAGKRTVECIDRNFYNIPEGIDLDTQVLDVSSNNINILQKEIFLQLGITNLQKLYLRKCKLEFIDDRALRGVTNMDELDLSDNQLSSVPSLIYIPYLKSINLAHNPIHQISSYAFQATPGIRYVDLSNCQIHTVYSEAFYGIDKLDTLKLNGNKLVSLKPRTIDKLSYIRNLDIYDNPWSCDCKLRDVKLFIDKYNIQFSFDPICISGPKKNIGQTFIELSANDFACVPEIEVVHNDEIVHDQISVKDGLNITLECRVQSITPCRIIWSVNHKVYDHVNWNSNKVNIKEETVVPKDTYLNPYAAGTDLLGSLNSGSENLYDQRSVITVLNAKTNIDDGSYLCIVENNAGRAEKLITVEFKEEPQYITGNFQARSLLIAMLIIILVVAFAILVIKLVNRNISSTIVKSSNNSSVGSVVKSSSLGESSYDNSTELPARPPLPKDIDLHNAQVVQCSSDLDLVNSARYNEWHCSTPQHFNRSKSSSGFYDVNDHMPIINLSTQTTNSIQDFPPDFGLPVVNDYDKIPSAKTLRVWQRGVPVLPQYSPGKRSIISFKNNQATDV